MKLSVWICWLSLCSVFAEEPIRILPIGDSITQGGVRGRAEYTYRLPLQRLLHARGKAFEFLGTREGGVQWGAVWPNVAEGVPFQANHFGFYGGRTAEVSESLKDALPQIAAPDVALIHLGTNDLSANRDEEVILKPLREIIDQLREKNPGVTVLVAHLNFNSGPALRLRPKVEAMVNAMHTEMSPVRSVPMYRDWIENPNHPQTDTFDWLHPNPQGQRKMAEAWLKALEEMTNVSSDE